MNEAPQQSPIQDPPSVPPSVPSLTPSPGLSQTSDSTFNTTPQLNQTPAAEQALPFTSTTTLNAPVAQSSSKENIVRGLLFSLLVIPVGIILWIILWKMGFIAAIVAFVIARGAFFLYEVGAKMPVSRKSAFYVIGVIIVGLILAFLSGMTSDALDFYTKEGGASEISSLLSADFWSYLSANLFNNPELWSSYFADIGISVLFAVLGSFSVIKSVFTR